MKNLTRGFWAALLMMFISAGVWAETLTQTPANAAGTPHKKTQHHKISMPLVHRNQGKEAAKTTKK